MSSNVTASDELNVATSNDAIEIVAASNDVIEIVAKNVDESKSTSNDVAGEGAINKKRNRRKPHAKKVDKTNNDENIENVDSTKQNVEVKETDKNVGEGKETDPREIGEKSTKKKRNRKKSIKKDEEKQTSEDVPVVRAYGVYPVEAEVPVENSGAKAKKRKPKNRKPIGTEPPKHPESAEQEPPKHTEPEVANGPTPEAEVGEKKKQTRRPNRSKKSGSTDENNLTPIEVGSGETKTARPPKSPKKEFRKVETKTEPQKFEQKSEAPELDFGNLPNFSSQGVVVGMYHGRGNQNRGNVPHQQPRNGQNQNQNQTNRTGNNRNQFSPHYLPEQVQHSLERGLLIEGVLRINPKNYKDAFVNSPCGLTADIMVNEIVNRNRALEGDVVAIDLNDRSEWKVLNEQIIEQIETDAEFRSLIAKLDNGCADPSSNDTDDDDVDDDVIIEEIVHLVDGKEIKREVPPPSQQQKSNGQTSNGRMPNGQNRIKSLNEARRTFDLNMVMKLPKWEQFVQRTGRVVAIIEKNHSRKAAGHLEVFPDGNPSFAFFKPTDSRVPRMKIPRENCPPDFFVRSDDFKQYLFVAEIVKWEMVGFALGNLIHNLGKDSDIEARTNAILLENDVDIEEFSEEVGRCLPDLPFVIPAEEIRKRKDFRSECVFTVDPLTARDLDDALSIEQIGDGRYRVGVHIADVSFFVAERTSLDHVASKRATSVYMVQRVIPMLPRVLCENLCSLNPGVDRLTFSVEWILNESGEIESEWFGRSVISSCVKLAYEHAQQMIDKPEREWKEDQLPEIQKPWSAVDVSRKVNMLQKIAVNLRQKRVDSGALRIDQPKICFILDKESWLPTSFKLYQHRDSNRMIEEFMLLANMSVAKKLYFTFPDLALLRNHPPPPPVSMEKVVTLLRPYGVALDGTSSKTLQDSFNNFKAAALGLPADKNVSDKIRKDDRKKSNKVDKKSDKVDKKSNKVDDSVEDDDVNLLNDRSDENVVDDLSEKVDQIKLDVSADAGAKKKLDRPTKSEAARANISADQVGAKTRKFYTLNPLSKERQAELKFQVLMSLCAKPMKPAQYFCCENKSPEKCRHYALSVDLYTHFTSPIRRYPDIMVHRLLEAALTGVKPDWLPDYVSKISSNCNGKKYTAKKVSEKSDELFLTLFVKECGPLVVNAMVLQVFDHSVDCLLLDMAVIKRVYFDDLPDLKTFQFLTNKGKKVVELKWKEKTEGAGTGNGPAPETAKVFVQKLQMFSQVVLTLKEKSEYEFSAILNYPLN